MLLPSLLLGGLLLGGQGVVINEVSYDDTGTDDREFVELYNPTGKDVDISGWVLEATDTATPDNNADYTIPANTTLKAGKYYVLGAATVPNVNQVVGTTNLWENSQEALTLKDKDGNIVDTLVYEVNKGWVAAKMGLLEGEGVWGNSFSTDGSLSSLSRLRDGYDSQNNRDFVLRPSTPGATNDLPSGPYLDTFDARTVETALPDFGAAFEKPFVIDPTKASLHNPNVIAASPQGKLAAVFWDSAGGGNTCMLLRNSSCIVTVEAWVYFDAKLEATGEREVWSLGVQGSSGPFFNFPDPSGAAGFHANGNTGVCWTFEVTDSAATLYLVDHNDGGRKAGALWAPKTDRTVLGKIVLKAGTDDGWKRLRLEVNGNNVTGFFGGTYGGTDGTKLTGTLAAPAEGDVWVGYREFLANNATARPFTCDRLTVIPSTSSGSIVNFGTVKATTKGTPRIGTNGCAILGNGSFRLTGGGLVPASNPSLMIIGIPQNPPIDLGAVGGQNSSFLYVAPLLIFGNVSDANGDTAVPLPIANDTALKNVQVSVQILDIDTALTVPLPFGNSGGMTFTIGG